MKLPELSGKPITVEFRPTLRVRRNKLVSSGSGVEVHAACFIRQRLMILDTTLRRDRRELARIVTHELAHFVWTRLSNAQRAEWEALIQAEHRRRLRGELGWSAEWRKTALKKPGSPRRWRIYLCEAFCDTAAWLFSGLRSHDEFTLAASARAVRRRWFAAQGLDRVWRI